MVKENECPECEGRGWYTESDRHGMQVQVQCEHCCGRGELQDPQANISQSLQPASNEAKEIEG